MGKQCKICKTKIAAEYHYCHGCSYKRGMPHEVFSRWFAQCLTC
jgi:hypothetical protein